MRTRKEIEKDVGGETNKTGRRNLALTSVEQIFVELLLDIRDLLTPNKVNK